MKNFDREFADAKNLLQSARRIVIISHRGPDGDTVGANLALRRALKTQWNKEIISACADSPPVNSDFLADFNEYKQDFDLSWPDALIAVDAGADYMLKFGETKPALFSGAPPMINMDHHASNNFYGKINIVDPEAAAACQIVYRFLIYCGFKIDREIATCLLHGLYFDTGSFMHSNTSPETLETAAALMWRGADAKTISRKQFRTMPVAQLKLFGKILERAHVSADGVTSSALVAPDFEETGANPEDAGGAIDYLNSVPGGKFCCLLYEDRKGMIKGSFRTRTEIDLAKLAGRFGGGGHKKAAGFSFPGRLRELSPRITIDTT